MFRACALEFSSRRFSSSARARYASKLTQSAEAESIIQAPSWSVRSLLPSKDSLETAPSISSEQLNHLLRLSALPPPKDKAEEARMLETLSSQLHFVKDIQNVDTTDVTPLQSIRDETNVGRKEAELGLAALSDALSKEEVVGKFHKRIRRRRDLDPSPKHESWNVLGSAEKKVGRYFVVEGGKD